MLPKKITLFIGFSLVFWALHKWALLPLLEITDLEMPALNQHLVLGGIVLLGYIGAFFVAKHFYDQLGFYILAVLFIKMLFGAIFIDHYDSVLSNQPVFKYIFLGLYFGYLLFFIAQILSLFKLFSTENKEQ